MRISSIIPCVRNANGSGHEQRRQTDGPGKDEVNRMNDFRKTAQEMLEFIRISPTCFHAVANIGRMLEEAGFQQLQEKEEWKLEKGGRYYTERNDSSVIAFVIPEKEVGIRGFHMAAAHSDSPCFKIKEKPELTVEEHYLRLNTEKYGGMICAPWFDRPLSIAGRLVVSEGSRLVSKLVNVDRDLVMIPNLAIHMNRQVNDGYAYNAQKDMLPVFGSLEAKGTFMSLIAEAAGVKEEDILGHDLFLYNRQPGTIWGADETFLSCGRLDDLQCAFSSVKAVIEGENSSSISVAAIFDNEEVGSGTKQGADSTFLKDVLERINDSLGRTREQYLMAVASSFMISADNAHAVHPNHADVADLTNRPAINEGIVIKYNANQKYTTDAVSAAVFKALCKKVQVPVQTFTNRSDIAGGSTLGNISNAHVSLNTVDIGLPQFAMHSPYETAGVKDTCYLIKAATEFFNSCIVAEGNGNYSLGE